MPLEADVVRMQSGIAPSGLHGRREIFSSESVITRENVVDVLNKALGVHGKNRAEILYLEKYLRGIQPILHREKKYNKEVADNKIVVNIANEIITFKTAEFAGS